MVAHFKPFSALVIGDFMLDTYTTGKVRRISPEAPVPVMEVIKQESRPGGAGNVVLNLLSLGALVFPMGRIGSDEEGLKLKGLLSRADTGFLWIEPGYKTPVKNRMIADSQQLMRVDFETIAPIHAKIEQIAIEELKQMIPKVDVVAISDYGKGFLSEKLIQQAIAIARQRQIPIIVDPKGVDFSKYRGASVLKPNLTEAYAAAHRPLSAPLEEVAAQILPLTDLLMITRSEAGISIFSKEIQRRDFFVHSKEVKDVTGAGDTVLAVICLALANGLPIEQAAEFANAAAGIVIERIGCVQVTTAELTQRILEMRETCLH